MILGHCLPPLVSGELCGEVEVSILLVSLIDNSPSKVSVSPRWWGSQENDEGSNETRLYPQTQDSSSDAALAAALIKADEMANTFSYPSSCTIIHPVIADSEALTRYFVDASTLTLIVRDEVNNSIIGSSSISVSDTLGRGQKFLSGVTQVKTESSPNNVKGSLVYVIRLRSDHESSFLENRYSPMESGISLNETSPFMSTVSYLALLKQRQREAKGEENKEIKSEQYLESVKKADTKSIVDLDITYPLAAASTQTLAEVTNYASSTIEATSTSRSLKYSPYTDTKQQQDVTSSSALPIVPTLSTNLNQANSQNFLHTSFEVAEQVALSDIHNLLPTPSSLLRKRTAAEDREKKARDLSGGIVGQASRGTSQVLSTSQLIDASSSNLPSHNHKGLISPNSSSALVRELRTQHKSTLNSPFAATAPRPDGVNDLLRATENHELLNQVDLWSAEVSSSATSAQQEGNVVSSSYHNDNFPKSQASSSTLLVTELTRETLPKTTEDPSLWLAGIAQPGHSRQSSDNSYDNNSAKKISYRSLFQLLSRSSATLKGIDEALVIGTSLEDSGPLHDRAMYSAAASALGAKLKAAESSPSHIELPWAVPAYILSNLTSSEATFAAYQDVAASLNSGAMGSISSTSYENTTFENLISTSLLLGVDERTMAIINEAASCSMGELNKTTNPIEERDDSLPMNTTERVNDPLSRVLREANRDYFRLNSALSTAESALRLPSLTLLGDRLRSLSRSIGGISVSVSAAILFPAATVMSAHQSSGRFGSIALLAIEDEKGTVNNDKNNLNHHPRVVKQQSAQALKDWLGGCKVWLEYTIPRGAISDEVDETCDDNLCKNELNEIGATFSASTEATVGRSPGATVSVSIAAQPVGLSEHSQPSNLAIVGGNDDKRGANEKVESKRTSPTKSLAVTSANSRKSLAPPNGSPLRLTKTSLPVSTSSSTPLAQNNPTSSSLTSDAAHLLLASIPDPFLSIPQGYVSDWDRSHSVMNLDSLAHTTENKISFDDEMLSRWLGNANEGGLLKEHSSLPVDSSIIFRLYLDASSQEHSSASASKSSLSSLQSSPSKDKSTSLPKGESSDSLPNITATPSYGNERILIGEGHLPLRQLLLSDALSLDSTVDIYNSNSIAQRPFCNNRATTSDKTLATLKQVRSLSSNVACDALHGPLRDSTDVINSRNEAFLSSLSLTSEERERVRRALAVRIAAVENDAGETKRVVAKALSPLQKERLGEDLLTDHRAPKMETAISSTATITSEVVARVHMSVSLLREPRPRDTNVEKPSPLNLVETLRSLPNQASETEIIKHKILSNRASQRDSHAYNSSPPSLQRVLGVDWETLRLPPSSFILQSKSERRIDESLKSNTAIAERTSIPSSAVLKLVHVLSGDVDVVANDSETIEESCVRGGGASLILSLHRVSSVSPRGALTASGGSSTTYCSSHSKSSIVSLFVRVQPNRAIFSIPNDEPHVNVQSIRKCIHSIGKLPPSSSLTSLPVFSLTSDVVLPFRAPSSSNDSQGLAAALLSSNRSGCVIEVYGLIASADESHLTTSTPLSTNLNSQSRLISREPVLIGTVLVPLTGVADALSRAARSENSLWDGPERVLLYPKVLDIVHPACAELSSCGHLSLSLFAAANGRQALVFTGQSAAALEIQKWWLVIVVSARKNRMERERVKREEEEALLKVAEDERLKKTLPKRVPNVNAKASVIAEAKTSTPLSVAAPARISTNSAVTVETQDSFHLKSISPERILTATKAHRFSQNSNPWVIESTIYDNMDVISTQNTLREAKSESTSFDAPSVAAYASSSADETEPESQLLDQISPLNQPAVDNGDVNIVSVNPISFVSEQVRRSSSSSTLNLDHSDMNVGERVESLLDLDEEAHVTYDEVNDTLANEITASPTTAIDVRPRRDSTAAHSLDDECKMIDDQPLESARPSFISEVPRLRIDSLENALLEREKTSSFLLSSLFPSISSHSSTIDKETATLSIDNLLARLVIEKIDGEGAAVETLKTVHTIEEKDTADSPRTAKKATEFELINVNEGVRISYSSINADTASSKINDCVGFDSIIDREEQLYESSNAFTVDAIEMDRPQETIRPSHHLITEAHNYLSVGVQEHSDHVLEVVISTELQSDTDMYSLDFESVTHTEEGHNDEDRGEDEESFDKQLEDNVEGEDKLENVRMDLDNHLVENHLVEDHFVEDKLVENHLVENYFVEIGNDYDVRDDNTDEIPGYIAGGDEKSEDDDYSADSTPAICPLVSDIRDNRPVIDQSNNHDEVDHFDFDEDVLLLLETDQERFSPLMTRQRKLLRMQTESLTFVNEVEKEIYVGGRQRIVYQVEHENNSDLLLSLSSSLASLLEFLSRQEKQFFGTVDENIDSVYNEDNDDSDGNEFSAFPAVNELHPTATGKIVKNIVAGTRQTFSLPLPPSSVAQSSSITLSEIEEALTFTEAPLQVHKNGLYDGEDVDMERLVQSPRETVAQLLGSTFEEEVFAAVAVNSGRVNSDFFDRFESASSTNHASDNVTAWMELEEVIDHWVESQRKKLPVNNDASSDKVQGSLRPSLSVTHVEKDVQEGSTMVTDNPNTHISASINVTDTFIHNQERRHVPTHLSTLTSADFIPHQRLQHLHENFQYAVDEHARLRGSLGLPSSASSSSTSMKADAVKNNITSQTQSSHRTLSLDKRRTPKRLIDTNKLAELLRGVSSR